MHSQAPNWQELIPKEGVKHDIGKARFDLLPPDVLYELAGVLEYGAKKYQARNWEKGMDWGRVYAALQRHLNDFWMGEDYDRETGFYHLDHALACLVFLSAYQKRKIGKDDRNKLEYIGPK